MFRSIPLTVACLICTLTPALADTTADPAADLAAITAKAGSDPMLTSYLQQLTRMGSNGRDRVMLQQQILGQFQNARNGITKPVHYSAAAAVMRAQRRAQIAAQILTADLDNDGQITKAEVKDTLEFMPQQGAAEAFFTSDQNDDNILSADEIRDAVEAQMSAMSGYDQPRGSFASLFDFDNDGYLTAEEFDRGAKALGY